MSDSKEIAQKETSLANVFDENAKLSSPAMSFLNTLIKENPQKFQGLFNNTGNVMDSDKEWIVHQIVRGVVKSEKTYSPLSMASDEHWNMLSAVRALSWLEREDYVVVNPEQNKIMLTNKMLGRLQEHYKPSVNNTGLRISP